MTMKSSGLSTPQWEVLQWVADGCPYGTKHDKPTAKTSAQALANRGLVTIKRGKAGWRASMTEKGAECLRLRRYPLPEPPNDTVELDLGAPKETTPRKRRDRPSTGARVVVSANGEALDAEVVRRILATDPRFNVPASVQKKLKLNKDVVYKQEVDMKFEVKITRVQVATRYVTATDQEAAAEKIRAQMEENPYRMYANYETVGTEIEVTRVEEQRTVTPLQIDREGPLLISLADAARATGISYSQLGQLAAQGGIEQVKVGSRRYLKRKSLLEFIDRNTHRGWAY